MFSWILTLGICCWSGFKDWFCYYTIDIWCWNKFLAERQAVWYLSNMIVYSMKSATSCSLNTITLLDLTSNGIPLLLTYPFISSLQPSFFRISFFFRKFWARDCISPLNRPVNWSNLEFTIISMISYLFSWLGCLNRNDKLLELAPSFFWRLSKSKCCWRLPMFWRMASLMYFS